MAHACPASASLADPPRCRGHWPHTQPSRPGRIASSICADLICDRDRKCVSRSIFRQRLANGLARLGGILYFTIVKLKEAADDPRGKKIRPFSRAHAECEELATWSRLGP